MTRGRRGGLRLDVLAVAVAALVNERYLDPRFTLGELSKELRVALFVLRRRFTRFYGLTLDEHLALRRIELATLLMESSPYRLGGLELVARRSGYPGVGALDRDFLRYRRVPVLAAWLRMASSRSASPGESQGDALLLAGRGT
ncbi:MULTISPECIES: hypothetical protein [unclassified Rathayibacter]|uniref:hypothetical protein n=1 Tax=unclassified Rathayibacter TaxID=2609250 RepID=UPI00188B897C|nr:MULTISPECIES: hypothetical protein [unclassified Rathayibacter]MBF4462322.1 hypothetical protein [Rathayibacter sp. VKM Ac-2879]MBF4503635.1 hypothetical protein [Rathayibacter sp. VKM Ac-2878]